MRVISEVYLKNVTGKIDWTEFFLFDVDRSE
jgi:hypothetical protein